MKRTGVLVVIGILCMFGLIMIVTGHSNTCAHPIQVGQSQVCK